ncbi:MAG: zinc-binding dehydrogenase, partial [Verrucomicrobiae bacterium]|nr:zinc-binding dehydrogenase [Verrucomicrobiae bacterium]
ATGGVGCLTTAILAHLGYRVTAVTGKVHLIGWLQTIGAAEVVPRDVFLQTPNKPLLSARWDAGVDTVGGAILPVVLRQIRHRGLVTACGNVGGAEFTSSVYPFILRGVTLAGIDTAQCPMEQRRMLWTKLAGDWRPPVLDMLARECTLDELNREIDRMLRGEQFGRVIVRLDG